VEEASLPFHLVDREPGEAEEAMARLLAGNAELWARYGGWLASLHPAVFAEVEDMARKPKNPPFLDLSVVIEKMGLPFVIEQAGVERVAEFLGTKKLIQAMGGAKEFVAKLSPEDRRELQRLLKE